VTRMSGKPGLLLELDYVAAAQLVFDAYIDFLTSPVDPAERRDPKGFTAWNAAGRAAMAHLGDVLKRVETSGTPAQQDAVGEIVADARRSFAALTPDAKEDPDADPGVES